MPNNILCPKCGNEIDIENIIEAGAKDALEKELALHKKSHEEELKKLKKEKDSLKEKLETEKEKEIEDALKEQEKKFSKKEESIRRKIFEEQEDAQKSLEEELKVKSEQVKELNKLKVDMARLEREKAELKDSILAETQKELNQTLIEEKQKMQKTAEGKFELKISELEKQLDDQKKLTEEMKKRQEQGSMQLQGEIQELAIEKYLSENFKYDEIKEIGKGDMGADSLQIIHTQYRPNCGLIYYESKRTKTFSEAWIGKFKDDIKEKGADIGVLVTAVYPKEMTRMGLRDGIYICTYEEFKALSFILRDTLIKISNTKMMQENKEDKSTLLYNYLTSTEFKFQFEAIVNAFVTMQTDLDSEKRAMNGIWKKREKQIQNVLTSTTEMYGSIQGISGNAIQKVEILELPILEKK